MPILYPTYKSCSFKCGAIVKTYFEQSLAQYMSVISVFNVTDRTVASSNAFLMQAQQFDGTI